MKTFSILTLMLVVSTTAPAFQQDPVDTSMYSVAVENLPQPVGGIAAIQKQVAYPEIAKKAGIQGTVYVEAYVNESGKVVRTTIAKGVHPALDKAASDAIMKTKFVPGTQEGKPIKVRLAIPIRFRLDSMGKAQKHKLYPGNYPMSAGGIEVPENAEWKAMNTEIEKDKVLLVLQEKWKDQQGFWSVMSYLTKKEALKLAKDLEEAAGKIK